MEINNFDIVKDWAKQDCLNGITLAEDDYDTFCEICANESIECSFALFNTYLDTVAVICSGKVESLESTVPEDLADDRTPKQLEDSTLDKTEPVDYKAEVAREKGLTESQAQETGDIYKKLSKKYNIDFDELVYGPDGFMATNYSDGFPDFVGDLIYSEIYWNEFVDWVAQKYGIDLKESLTEFYTLPAIESDQKLYGIDNAVVDCQKYDLVAHSEDEKPLDCKMEKAPLEKPLTEGATPLEIKEIKDLAAKIGISTAADLQDFINREALVDETPLETLKRYIAWLGDDFKLIDTKAESKAEEDSQLDYTKEHSVEKLLDNAAMSLEDLLNEDFDDYDIEDSAEEVSKDDTDEPIEEDETEVVATQEVTDINSEVKNDETNKVLADLLIDEKEAIDGYNKALDKLDDQTSEKAKEVLKHIEGEELEHIEELSKVVAGNEDEVTIEDNSDEDCSNCEKAVCECTTAEFLTENVDSYEEYVKQIESAEYTNPAGPKNALEQAKMMSDATAKTIAQNPDAKIAKDLNTWANKYIAEHEDIEEDLTEEEFLEAFGKALKEKHDQALVEDTAEEDIYAEAEKLIESTENGKLLQNASSMLNGLASKINAELVANGINDADFRVMSGKGSKIGIFGEKAIAKKLVDALHSLKGKVANWGIEEPRDAGATAGVLIDNISLAQGAVTEDLSDVDFDTLNASPVLEFPTINSIIESLELECGRRSVKVKEQTDSTTVVEVVNEIDASDLEWDEDGDYDPFSGGYESGISIDLDSEIDDFEGLIEYYVEEINKENIFEAEIVNEDIDTDELYLDDNWDERGYYKSLEGEVVQTITLKITKK